MNRFILILLVIVCGCQSTRQPKRDVELSVDVPVGAPEKARVTATIKASF